tara:strand:- start:742 stop:1821 length:1080 start_codon:yes stop_codon:yes gene_type:complete
MNINIVRSSLLSNIMALSLNKHGIDNINIRKSKLTSYGRYYSLNFFSKKYLEHINIWDNLDQNNIVPYKKIEIYKKSSKTLSFDAKSINIDHLGFIVNEDDLVKAITKIIISNKKINHIPDEGFDNNSLGVNIISDYKDVDLEVQSEKYRSKDYNQTAININITHQNTNNNIPRQIFYNNEILGFLPVNEYCYNLIWSMPNKLFEELSLDNIEQCKNLINDRANFILGDIKGISIGKSFPLSARHAGIYFYNNNLLIGEAAHKFHPLAGLGLNMGIEDIALFTQLISQSDDLKTAFREYAIGRISKNNSLQYILDLVIEFHSTTLMPDTLKSRLLNLFDSTVLMKPIIIKNATGCDNKI